MRRFQAKVFDDVVDASTPLYIDPSFHDVLGIADGLSIHGVAVALSGTSPTLTVQIEESPNEINWRNKQGTPEINVAALSLTTFTNVQGRDPGSTPSACYLRLRIQVGGTSPRVLVKLWVTGRGEQPS